MEEKQNTPTFPPATVKKKIAVVGGGPAGLEFALTAASRGHEILLFEKENELGGNLKFAAAPPFKSDMRKYLEWLINAVKRNPNVKVKLSVEATPIMVKKENPDVVIVAVGSQPYIPEVQGIEKDNVFWAGDVLMGKAHVGEKVVIAGAGLVGCETALHLSQQGKKVTLIDILSQDEIAQDMPPTNRMALFNLLHQYEVEFKTEVYLERVMEDGVLLVDKQWKKLKIPAETIVLALGMKPRSETAEKFTGAAPEVYTIGDCVKPGKLHDAIHQAFNIAVEL
ncbi:MAG: FAD-dependent oxidoreductase [Candidatus Bathyarchaeia archaeon]